MMNRKILLIIAGILATAGLFAQSGNLVGMVKNQGDGQAIPFASVQLFKDGKKAVATQSDIDGKYKLDKISPGSYSLKIKAVGYDSLTISDVTINANRKLTMNIEVTPKQTRINEKFRQNQPAAFPLPISELIFYYPVFPQTGFHSKLKP